jgi:PAS domain S-box-containing protein
LAPFATVLVETAPDAIVLADGRGTIILWNKAAQALFGYTAQEAIGKPLTLIMPARYRDAHAKGLERARASGYSRLAGKPIEMQGLKKDGSEFPVELSLGTWNTPQGPFFSGIVRDITERKRAEEALRESQERFYQVAENIREVFWMTDPEKNRMIYVSPGYEDIWGRTCESLEASPRSWLEAIHPDDRDRVLQAALTKQISGTYDEEYRIVRPDGSTRWIWDRAFPVRDASGRVYRITGIAEDITDRKNVEEELRASEERLELAVRGSSDGLWDGRVLPGEPWSSPRTPVWYSPRFKAMLGFEEHELDNVLGSWVALLHPEDKDRVLAALFAHVERKEPYDVEYRLRTKQGEYRWFRARGQAIWDEAGNPLRMAGSLQCITDRKRAEQALQQAYDETGKILASLPGAILAVDQDLRVGYANALACQYFGEGGADMAAASLNDVLPGEVAQRCWVYMRRTPQAAENGYWQQDREFERHGKVYQYRFFPLAIRGSERPQTGIVLWDITENKRLGDQIMQAEKLASLGTLVAGMAHEVNNPAQAIMGLAQLMQDEPDLNVVRDYARDIVAYTKHIATVVRDFSTYARQSDGDEETELDLGERMAEAVKLLRRSPHFGHVEVVTDFRSVPFLKARRTEIDQVFVNLIGNAVQAMDSRGCLTLSTALRGDAITASVRDTGGGIPKDRLARIFDPFYTTKEPGKGTGLGLYIVHKIVAKHGGQIHVDSKVGQGTTFTVAFPVTTSGLEKGHHQRSFSDREEL